MSKKNDFTRGIRLYLENQEFLQDVNRLTQKTDELQKHLSHLTQKAKEMTQAGKATGAEWNELQREIKKTTQTIINNSNKIAKHNELNEKTKLVLRDLSGKSYNDLIQVQRRLSRELKALEKDSKQYNIVLEQQKRVTGEVALRQREMRSQVGASSNVFSRMANRFNKYFGIATAGIATVTGLSFTFRRLAEDVAKMDDVYSDVMKTTGMTHDEVKALNNELNKIDTRTSREELNYLARDAGKLGIEGTENILKFVEAGNQINVALGEDLGEGAIKNIGKMVGVFDKSTEHLRKLDLKNQMLAVGSAINELGASSSANEAYLVQFAGRLGGVASQAGISIDEILGYASALDQDMQQVEMAATALQNFIMKIMGEPTKFAQIAGQEVGEFARLLETDVNRAIKLVLKSLSEKGGFQQLIPIFNDMGLDGARAVGVLSSMASSIGKIDEAQRVANKALVEGTSITTEYAIKNENLAAQLDKARKDFKEISLELGEKLNPVLLKSTKGATNLIKVLVKHPGIIKTLLIALGSLAAIYTLVTAKKIKDNVVTKSALILSGLSEKGTKLLAVAQYLLAGNIKRATVAWRALNTAMKANVITLAISLVAGLATAIYKLATRTNEAQKAKKRFNEELTTEQIKLDNLFEAYKNANSGTSEKLRLLNLIKSNYGDYISNLIDEEGQITNIAEAQKQANMALNNNLVIKSKNAALEVTEGNYINRQRKLVNSLRDELNKQLGEQQSENLYATVNQMFQQSGVDVNKTARIAIRRIKENGATVTKSIRKTINKMASEANMRNIKRREADDEFDPMLQKPKTNILETLIVTPKKRKPNNTNSNNGSNGNMRSTSSKDSVPDAYDMDIMALEKRKKTLELYWTKRITDEKRLQEILFENHLEYLDERLAIEKQYGKDTTQTKLEIIHAEREQDKDADTQKLQAIQELQKSGQTAIMQGEQTKLNMLEYALAKRTITQEQYEKEKIKLEQDSATARIALAKSTIELLKKAELTDNEKRDGEIKKMTDEVATLEQKLIDAGIALEKLINTPKEEQSNDEQMQSIFGTLYSDVGNVFAKFKDLQDDFNNDSKKSWSEWAETVGNSVQAALELAQNVSDQYFDYRFNALEADKQAELTANNDKYKQQAISAEEYEKEKSGIEQKYAQKELDLKKQQANADAVIKSSQAFIAGSLAILEAYAQLGPIGGAIAAVAIGGITALQVANIIKERNIIMATTLESSNANGGSNSPKLTGKLVPNNKVHQAEHGRYEVIGEDDGRTYRGVHYSGRATTGIYPTPTLVAERGDELIVDNPTLKNIRMNAPYVLHEIQRQRVPQRSLGNYNSVQNTAQPQQSTPEESKQMMFVMEMILQQLDKLDKNGLHAYVLLNELEKKMELKNRSNKLGRL